MDAIQGLRPVDLGNARLRDLAAHTVGRDWWKLLWLPPSLPYLQPGGPYAEPGAASADKRLVFSAWTAVPKAIACLLSHEAERHVVDDEYRSAGPQRRAELRQNRRSRLAYRMDREGDRERPSSMSTLAIFWPMPGLARLADPRRAARTHARAHAGGSPTGEQLREEVVDRLRTEHREDLGDGLLAAHWYEALRRTDSSPDGLTPELAHQAVQGLAEDDDRGETPSATGDQADVRGHHMELALQIRGLPQDRPVSHDTLARMADVAAHSPGTLTSRTASGTALPYSSAQSANVTNQPASRWFSSGIRMRRRSSRCCESICGHRCRSLTTS